MNGKEKKENQPGDIDKRKFLKGACLLAGGAALLGLGGVAISGCSVSGEGVDGEAKCTTATTTTTVIDVEYLGECICPSCGISIPHPRGVPCRLVPCPKCNTSMGRANV
jgi:hypothetical protein